MARRIWVYRHRARGKSCDCVRNGEQCSRCNWYDESWRKEESYAYISVAHATNLKKHKRILAELVYNTGEAPIHTHACGILYGVQRVPALHPYTQRVVVIARVWNTHARFRCVRAVVPFRFFNADAVRAGIHTDILRSIRILSVAHTDTHTHTHKPKQMTNKRTMRVVCHEQPAAHTHFILLLHQLNPIRWPSRLVRRYNSLHTPAFIVYFSFSARFSFV